VLETLILLLEVGTGDDRETYLASDPFVLIA
jgi:hypothetical protein